MPAFWTSAVTVRRVVSSFKNVDHAHFRSSRRGKLIAAAVGAGIAVAVKRNVFLALKAPSFAPRPFNFKFGVLSDAALTH